MKRVVALVDGFNLFHALKSQDPDSANINLVELISRLVDRNTEELRAIVLFTALVTHLSVDAQEKQRMQLRILRAKGVQVIVGNFKSNPVTCRKCGHTTIKNSEKETDVNIALALVDLANAGQAEKVLLFSADTDMLPAVRRAKQINRVLDVRIVSTKTYLRNVSRTLLLEADGQIRLTKEFVARFQV